MNLPKLTSPLPSPLISESILFSLFSSLLRGICILSKWLSATWKPLSDSERRVLLTSLHPVLRAQNFYHPGHP